MVEDVYPYLPFIISLCLYFLVGTVGNILIIIVYWRERVKLSHTLFIRVLSLIDLTICCVIIPYTIAYELHVINIDIFCRFFEFIRHVLVFYSNFIPIAIAFERYFAVCKPMKKLSYDKLSLTLSIGLVICVVFAAPAVTMFGVCAEGECLGLTEILNESSQTGNSSAYNETSALTFSTSGFAMKEESCQFTTQILGEVGCYAYQTFLFLFFFSSFILIGTFYTLVYRVVIKRSRWRRNRIGPIRLDTLNTSSVRNTHSLSQQTDQHITKDGVSKTGVVLEVSPKSVQHGETTSSHHFLEIPKTPYRKDETRKVKLGDYGFPHPTFNGNPGNIQKQGSSSSTSHQVPTISITVQPAKGSETPPSREKKRKTIGHGGKTGTMLFSCTIIYIMCWVPFWIDVFFTVENTTFRYLFLLGHVTNPIVYGIVSKAVRDEIWALFLSLRTRCIRGSDAF